MRSISSKVHFFGCSKSALGVHFLTNEKWCPLVKKCTFFLVKKCTSSALFEQWETMSISQKMHFSSYPHWTTNTRTALAFVFHFSPRGHRPLRNLCPTLLFVLHLASLPPGPKPFAKIVCVLCFFFICLNCFYFAIPRGRSPSRKRFCILFLFRFFSDQRLAV